MTLATVTAREWAALIPGGLFFVWAGLSGAGTLAAVYGAAIAAVSTAGLLTVVFRRR